MSAMSLHAKIEGIGFWTQGLPAWPAASHFAATGELPAEAAARPSPRLLAPNERRRAPESVAVALEVALAACQAAGRDPATLPAVFASTHGDLAITHYMCDVLASDPASVSPTRFHNSVHNAAAGYWTIGAGCRQAATAISAYHESFALGLIEALVQLADGVEAVLLVAYDTASVGPIQAIHPSGGLLGAALVLSRAGAGTALAARLIDGLPATAACGPLARHVAQHAAENAMTPMLPLFDALAAGLPVRVELPAGPGRCLSLDLR